MTRKVFEKPHLLVPEGSWACGRDGLRFHLSPACNGRCGDSCRTGFVRLKADRNVHGTNASSHHPDACVRGNK